MEIKELKFLLKLLGREHYRTSITNLKPNDKTTAVERDRICAGLGDRGIVAYSREIKKFRIDPAAKALLNQDTGPLLTDQQRLILKACESKAITPGELNSKIQREERQTLIQDLEAKGFIKVDAAQIKEVWLTERGHEYLREECQVGGTTTISLSLLQNYVTFLRKAGHRAPAIAEVPADSLISSVNGVANGAANKAANGAANGAAMNGAVTNGAVITANKPNDDDILQMIQDLDRDNGTDNYLPIFYLRQKVQYSLSREELDQALYRLQRQDKLEMSSLVDAIRYTPEQLQAGIPQDLGSPLFFLMVNV